VLADGTYDASGPFSDTNGSHLYAQHLGGAVLTAGLVIGGNFGSGGGSVQGVAFNVSSASKTFNGGEVYVWGNAGQNAKVLDSTFNGNSSVPVGLLAQDPGGLVAQRLTFTNFTDEGIRASNNVLVPFGGSTPVMNTITDISVNGVSRSTPGASDGTSESGVWIGEPVANGVHRIKIRNTAWSGIETCNNAWNTTFTDLDIDMSGPKAAHGVAVYFERFSKNLVFNGFSITGSSTGFNAEWDDGTPGNAAAHNVTIENGTIDAQGWTRAGHTVGIFLDVGSESTTVTNVTFKNQNWAAIGANQTTGTNSFSGNVYSVAAGATSVANGHI
jgi:hypothetical protein